MFLFCFFKGKYQTVLTRLKLKTGNWQMQVEGWQPCTSALQVIDLKCHSLQQGFPCLTETFPVVVSCVQPDQWSGNSQLVSDARPATSPCQSSSHNSLRWKASSFPLAASSIHIPPRVSDNKYYKITQIQMVWVGVASCSSTCELPLLSCRLAFTESISSVSYGLTAFLYKPSITHSSSVIFNYYCRYIRQRKSKLGAENQRVFLSQKMRSIFQIVSSHQQRALQFSPVKRGEPPSGVQLIFTNCLL